MTTLCIYHGNCKGLRGLREDAMIIDLDELASVAAGWGLFSPEQQQEVAAKLLELRVELQRTECGICPEHEAGCVLWDGHDFEGWQHVDDLGQMERDDYTRSPR